MLFARRNYVKMEGATDDTGAGAGAAGAGAADEDKAKAAVDASKQQIELLTRSVGLLAENLQKMEGNQGQIVAALAKITEQPKSDVKQQLETQFGDDVDLEQLDRKDFARYIRTHMLADIKGEVSKLSDTMIAKIEDLGGRFESKNANEQIERTANSNKDFWEWSSEIKGLLKESPTLSVSRAYKLARSENPDKAKELDLEPPRLIVEPGRSIVGPAGSPFTALGQQKRSPASENMPLWMGGWQITSALPSMAPDTRR